MQGCAQMPVAGRQSTVSVSARHVHRCKTSHIKRRVKKRDIRTSFITGPGLPISRTITSPTSSVPLPTGWGPQQFIPLNITPPLPQAATTAGLTSTDAPWLSQPAEVSLGETCRSDGTVSETVIAQAAVAADQAVDEISSSSEASSAATLAADGDSLPALASLAALDSILDGLIVAQPASVSVSTTSTASNSSSINKGSASPKKGSSSASRKGKKSSSNAAAAVPAVTNIQCEIDWQRELAAAVAQEQLVVVKVESGRNRLVHHSADPALRFQTNSNLPTSLNTYLPHSDSSYTTSNGTPSSLNQNLGVGFSSTAAAGLSGSLDSSYTRSSLQKGTALESLASLGLYGLNPSGPGGSSSSGGSLSMSTTQLDSPVHSWYLDLAAQYAAGSSNQGLACSPLRFLSLQSDSPRAKALCRRLGVSEGLSVLVVEPSSGKKMLEVCGTKIEQDLPPGLLYHSDVDPQGNHPSDVLKPISSKEQLQQLRSSSEVSVVAFHMHAAPPCIKTYGVLYDAARSNTKLGVSFAVMDIDSTPEHCELAAELELQRLPTYVVYQGGKEVARLASTSERKRLGGVLADVLAEPALAVAAV